MMNEVKRESILENQHIVTPAASIEPGFLPEEEYINQIINGDCLDVLKEIPENTIDLVVTDPPYGIGFMNKDWDKNVPSTDIWRESYRVLKPGALAFVMSSARQDKLCQMLMNLSAAGFKMDFTSMYWTYSRGVTKAFNIAKTIAKHVGPETTARYEGAYAGFQPKPSVEIIIVAMKTCEEKSFYRQALVNNKGITFLGKCLIPHSPGEVNKYNEAGRFPANLLVSNEILEDYSKYFSLDQWARMNLGDISKKDLEVLPFIISAKAPTKEREAGLEDLELKKITTNGEESSSPQRPTSILRRNIHPTVKPLALVSYLIKLGSVANDIILDPFVGSGTTCVAAASLNRRYIGIEIEADYCEIAQKRIEHIQREMARGRDEVTELTPMVQPTHASIFERHLPCPAPVSSSLPMIARSEDAVSLSGQTFGPHEPSNKVDSVNTTAFGVHDDNHSCCPPPPPAFTVADSEPGRAISFDMVPPPPPTINDRSGNEGSGSCCPPPPPSPDSGFVRKAYGRTIRRQVPPPPPQYLDMEVVEESEGAPVFGWQVPPPPPDSDIDVVGGPHGADTQRQVPPPPPQFLDMEVVGEWEGAPVYGWKVPPPPPDSAMGFVGGPPNVAIRRQVPPPPSSAVAAAGGRQSVPMFAREAPPPPSRKCLGWEFDREAYGPTIRRQVPPPPPDSDIDVVGGPPNVAIRRQVPPPPSSAVAAAGGQHGVPVFERQAPPPPSRKCLGWEFDREAYGPTIRRQVPPPPPDSDIDVVGGPPNVAIRRQVPPPPSSALAAAGGRQSVPMFGKQVPPPPPPLSSAMAAAGGQHGVPVFERQAPPPPPYY